MKTVQVHLIFWTTLGKSLYCLIYRNAPDSLLSRMLCGQHIRLDYDKQKQTIICQLKPTNSIRLQLQVNTCHTLGAVMVYIRRWHTLLEGLILD